MTSVAVLKCDYGVVGGFDRVLGRVENVLEDAGFDVTRYAIDVTRAHEVAADRRYERQIRDVQPEFLNDLYARDQIDGIATGAHDLVISTSPPSYVHRHRAHLALFYHHHRVFYDLEDTYIAAGFAPDPALHRHAGRLVRELDRPRLAEVDTFLCPSDAVQERLARFNDRADGFRFHAGAGVEVAAEAASPGGPAFTEPGAGALCVTRHEFPKRVELAVAAAHLLPDGISVTCTGTGGRLAWSRALDARLAAGEVDVEALGEADLWCNTGAVDGPAVDAPGKVRFVGHIDDRHLEAAYRDACCVVAPAFEEDYGLTVIEAMRHGRPVVVCRDGGGLAELVDDGGTGLVVEPTPGAIAAAVARLHQDRDLAIALGRNGVERAAELSWANAARQLLTAVEATLDGAVGK